MNNYSIVTYKLSVSGGGRTIPALAGWPDPNASMEAGGSPHFKM